MASPRPLPTCTWPGTALQMREGAPPPFFFFSSRRKINVLGLKKQKFHIQYGPKFLSVVYNAPFLLIIIFKSIYAQRVGCITFYTLTLGKRDLFISDPAVTVRTQFVAHKSTFPFTLTHTHTHTHTVIIETNMHEFKRGFSILIQFFSPYHDKIFLFSILFSA